MTTTPLIGSLTATLIAVLGGMWLGRLLVNAPITVPKFLLCLLVELALRNGGARYEHPGLQHR